MNEPLEQQQQRSSYRDFYKRQQAFSPSISRAHLGLHASHALYVGRLIEELRPRIGVQPVWSIEPHIFCTEVYPDFEGYCTWDEEKWYAELGICCALAVWGIRWVVAHELYELQGHREGNWVSSLIYETSLSTSHRNARLRDYQYVRNQTIEEQVQTLFGERRPFSLRADDAEGREQEEVLPPYITSSSYTRTTAN